MDNPSKAELEKELQEQLELELERRRNVSSKLSASEPGSNDDAKSNPADAGCSVTDTSKQRRSELEDELRKELDQQLGTPSKIPEVESNVDTEEQLREELEAELQKRGDLAKANHDCQASDDCKIVDNAPVRKTHREGPPDSDGEKKSDNETSSKLTPRKGGKKRMAGGGGKAPAKKSTMGASRGPKSTRIAGKAGTKATRILSEQDQKLIDEKAKIDQSMRKMKYLLYALIPLLSLGLFSLLILPNCFRSEPNTAQEVRRVIIPPSPNTENGERADSPRPANIPKPIDVVSMRTLKQEVNRLLAAKQNQSAVDIVEEYARKHPHDRLECREIVAKIAKAYLDAPAAGTRAWRDLQDQLELLLGSSADPENLQKAITSLGDFWNDNPNERFAADYLIQQLTADFVDKTNNMPNDGRNF